jgi:hypothetical protein
MRRSARPDSAPRDEAMASYDHVVETLPQLRLYLRRADVPALARLLQSDSGLFVLARRALDAVTERPELAPAPVAALTLRRAMAHAALGRHTPDQPTYARGGGAGEPQTAPASPPLTTPLHAQRQREITLGVTFSRSTLTALRARCAR